MAGYLVNLFWQGTLAGGRLAVDCAAIRKKSWTWKYTPVIFRKPRETSMCRGLFVHSQRDKRLKSFKWFYCHNRQPATLLIFSWKIMLNHAGFNYKATNLPFLLHELTKHPSHCLFTFTVVFIADAILIIATYKSTKYRTSNYLRKHDARYKPDLHFSPHALS